MENLGKCSQKGDRHEAGSQNHRNFRDLEHRGHGINGV